MKRNFYRINLIGCFFFFLFLSFFSFYSDAYPAASSYFDTVQKIYIGYYQRPADPSGLIYWADRLDKSGGNLNEIIEAYANSAESQALYGTINSSNISTVVNGIYYALCGRNAETEGLNYYVDGFNLGQFTPATIMLNVLHGAQNEDLQSVNNKMAAANRFTRTIDPDLDGSNFQATYSGDGDVIAGRNFLTLYATSVKIPTQAETTAYIKANIADPGDPILSAAPDGGVPIATISSATSITTNSATLRGNVTPNGFATTVWFEWGTDGALSSYASTSAQSAGSGTTSAPVNASLSGLSIGTTYYYRVAANNSSGTSKSTITRFILILPEPDPGVADIRDEFLAAVNQARSTGRICGPTAYGPAPPVSWSTKLAMAAYKHSVDMATHQFFSHTGSDGSSPGNRITREGYPWRTYGENIGGGYPSVSSVMGGWLASEGHCRNIMNPVFTEIGAGYAIGGERYWTFDLADQ